MTTLTLTRTDEKYIPVFPDSLRIDTVPDFDLHLMVDNNLILYHSANLSFTKDSRRKLMESKVERLYATGENRCNYQKYIEKNIGEILDVPTITDDQKARILYETSTNLIIEVLANPTFGENIQRSKCLVANLVKYILRGRESFLHILKIASINYHLQTHSVNVCTFSIALARQLGLTDTKFLNELGIGSLLHDVGKCKVTEGILYKRTSLSTIEFDMIKKHPQWGVEILRQTGVLPEAAYNPVLEHHERGDRSGYPRGLSFEEMHIYSKIVAIADCFDAMTTERAHQKAFDTFTTLKLMMSMKNAFDEVCLRYFVELIGAQELDELKRAAYQ